MPAAPLLALLLAQASAPIPPAPPATSPAAVTSAPPATWAGTVGLGFIMLTGNSETLTLSSTAAVERKSADWIWGFKASGAYGQNRGVADGPTQVTALAASAQARGDRRFTPSLASYLLAGIDTDHLKAIEARPYGEAGLSVTWLDQMEGELSKQSFKTDLGFRYGRELRFDYYPTPPDPRGRLDSVDIVAPRLGALYRYAFNKNVAFADELGVLGNLSGQTRAIVTNAAKLTSRLTEALSLGVAFAVNYDGVPPPRKKNTDTALTVGLELGL